MGNIQQICDGLSVCIDCYKKIISCVKMGFDYVFTNSRPSWDDYLMALACVTAIRSPDPATKHGTVIVDKNNRILGLGYNGFPRGGDYEYPTTRPGKYDFIIHSEPNAVLNCLIRPESATAYVTGPPCHICMGIMVQAGITKVVYGKIGSNMVDKEKFEKTQLIARNHGVELVQYNKSPHRVLKETLGYLDSKEWRDYVEETS